MCAPPQAGICTPLDRKIVFYKNAAAQMDGHIFKTSGEAPGFNE
jgi:hypothetical protein